MPRNCIDIKNYEGKQVIFTEEQRKLKSESHSELRRISFIKKIAEAIKNPGFVYEDFARKSRLVYYKSDYSINGIAQYIKVVVVRQKKFYFVITAYSPDYVKERGKSKLIYGKDKE